MKLLKAIYYFLFPLPIEVEPKVDPPADGSPRLSWKQWRTMVRYYEDRFEQVGELDAYTCGHKEHIVGTIKRDAGETYRRIVCPECPRVKTIGKLRFEQRPSWAMSARHYGGKGVDSLTPQMASYEFFRPSYFQYHAETEPGRRRHLEAGGLLLRKIQNV